MDVSGWSVQYHAATGAGPWQVTPLSGSIAPGQLYLVAEAAGAGGTTPLPTPQVTGTIPMAAASGTIALVNGTAPLTCQDSAACQSASVDLVGYGSTAAINESAPAPGGSSTTSLQRNGTTDTDDNSIDFAAATPTPAGANDGGGGPGTGTPGPLRTHDIQGATWISPHDDEQVTNVPGIVTGIRSSGTKGYWIQDPDPDSSAATSEGIFVFTSSSGRAR